MNESELPYNDGVAIIGLAGRFPGASTIDKLWSNLCEGSESITFFEKEAIHPSIDTTIRDNPNYIRARGILEHPDQFDASFFNISPRQAEILDPQNRIFLELAWTALEDAGCVPEKFKGLISVFAGKSESTYLANHINSNPRSKNPIDDFQIMVANEKDYLPTFISYHLDLKGPSVNVQTACSTSLVAVCQAFDSLMTFQCDVALAGGISIVCPQQCGYLWADGTIFSKDGHCRPFDSQSEGTVFGSGAGIVVLKRLEDALNDRDQIYAVIRGTALNNDGSAGKMSFMAPSVDGQANVIAMAHANAGLHPEAISYIEAHGTATPLGDPIEIEALTQAFRTKTLKNGFCAIGSIKSNFGHLDTAAGIAGLIKTALALKNRKLPPIIHFKKPNPNIDFENTPFYVNTQLSDWTNEKKPRFAGVSSFGVGGTNAHVVLEEAPDVDEHVLTEPWYLLVLSANTKPALEAATLNISNHIRRCNSSSLEDVAFTLQVGRKAFKYRRMLICQNKDDALRALEPIDPARVTTGLKHQADRQVVFMFSGQGTQHIHMGTELYKHEKIFRDHVDACTDYLTPRIGFDLREILYPAPNKENDAENIINQTAISQVALFVIESALSRLWIELGVTPEAMIGHSIGEYVAAYQSGVFSLESVLQLVVERGELMQAQAPGKMLALNLSEEDAKEFVNEELSIASVNAPRQCVISGPAKNINELKKKLTETRSPKSLQVKYIELNTSHAFHSSMMESAMQPFTKMVKMAHPKEPKIPFISNLTGEWITAEQAVDPNYWAKHLRHTVRFSKGIRSLIKNGNYLLLEMGPGQLLGNLARAHQIGDGSITTLPSLPHPNQKQPDYAFFLNSIGRYWLTGGRVKWERLYQHVHPKKISLPTYPFEGKRYWIEAKKRKSAAANTESAISNSTIASHSSKAGGGQTDNLYSRPDLLSNYIAPTNELEKMLVSIWQEALGIDRVGINDDFFELGGHSLSAADLFAKVEKKIKKNVPLAILYQAPTIKALAEAIRDEKTESLWSSMVPIRLGGKRKPIYLVHGAEGNVLLYRSLANYLGEDQPVYGLQAIGLDGSGDFNPDFKYVASMYIEEIRTLQPVGPYLLGGYCLGGTIALEMAQQLVRQGERVDLLAMIDIYNVHSMKWPQPLYLKIYNKLLNFWYHLMNLFSIDNEEKFKFFKEKTRVEISRMKIRTKITFEKFKTNWNQEKPMSYRHLEIDKAYDRAFEEYFPERYPGRITLFGPKKLFAGFDDKLTHGYGHIAQEGVTLHTIQCYPHCMLVEPHVKTLGEKIKESIIAAESQGV